MSGGAKPLAIVRRTGIAVPLACVGFYWALLVFAAQLPAQEAGVPAVKSPAGQIGSVTVKQPERRGSSTTFNLDRQQSIIQCVEVIQQSVTRKEYLATFPLLETMLSEPTTFVPLTPNTDVTACEFVKRILDQVPTEIRSRFEAHRRAAAVDAWERAKAGGIDEIGRFLRDYGESPLVAEAWWWIGTLERDHKHFLRAAAAFQNAANHPQSSPTARVLALIAAAEVLRETPSRGEFFAVQQQLISLDRALRFEVAGRSLTLADWLQENLLPSDGAGETSLVAEDHRTPARTIWRQHRPVLLPVWKHDLPNSPQTSLDKLTKILPDPAVRPFSIMRPVICGTRVLVRTTEDLHAFDIASGKAEWFIPNIEFQNIGKRIFENQSYRTVAVEWAQRRTQADSLFSRMTTDGTHLYVIQEPDRASEFRMENDAARGLPRVGPQFNQLCSYDLTSGGLAWEVGGPVQASPSQGLEGYFFLGPPLVLDDELFLVAQRDFDVQLLSLNIKQGALNWSIPLGTASLPIDEDLQRARTACLVVWHAGQLLCSTSSGIIVAVDPMMRSMKWSYRYPAVTLSAGDLFQFAKRGGRENHSEPWWEAWREPFMAVAKIAPAGSGADHSDRFDPEESQSILVFTSPESDELHSVNLPDGQPLWRVARNGGLTVAGMISGRIIVTEDEHIRAHDLRTGDVLWKTAIGQVCGPAVLTKSVVVAPLQSGGTILLDAIDGTVLNTAATADPPLGALAETDGAWIAFNRQTVVRLPQLDVVRESILKELKQDPGNESLRVRAALLDLQAGEVDSAREHLTGLTSSPARDLRRQALVAALEGTSATTSESSRTNLARELNELADNSDYKFAAAAAIGMSALAVNDLADTVEACLNGLSAGLDHHDSLVKRQSVQVRKDRVLLGLIDEAYRRALPTDLPSLDGLFQLRLSQARQSRDRFALQELWTQWRGIDWSRRLLVLDEEKVLRKRSFVEVELRLLDAAGCDDRSIGMEALRRLAERLDHKGLESDAKSIRRQAVSEERAWAFRKRERSAEALAVPVGPDNAEIAAATDSESLSDWPLRLPKIGSRIDRNFGIYAPQILLHSEPGSLAERLDIAIDRTGDEIYFRGETFFQTGQDEEHERRFTLSKSPSPLRGPRGYMLREGWGIGRIVVLLVGSELHAITPLDEQGEPNSRFLWAHSIDLELPVVHTEELPTRKAIHSGRRTLCDRNQQPLIAIGPVRASYLCYHQGKRLVAVDTESGRDLWRREDISADATVLGDDQRVFIWNKSGLVDVLSPIDGRQIGQHEFDVRPDNLIHEHGSLAWTATIGAETHLALHDLRTGDQVWSRIEPAESLIAILDSDSMGVVTPDGRLQILESRTGTPRCEPLVLKAGAAREIVAWQDSESWYIALSQSVHDLDGLKAAQPRDAYRLKFINGPLYAISRSSLKVLWRRDLKNEPLALEMTRTAPVLVQLWKLKPWGNNDASEGKLRVIDKRTGKTLIERQSIDVLPYYLLNPDRQQGMLELKLTQETITMDYATEQQVGEQPKPEKANSDVNKNR